MVGSTTSFISGRMGRAVILDEGRWWIEDIGVRRRPARESELSDIYDPNSGFTGVNSPSREGVYVRLASETEFHNLLFVALRLLDKQTSLRVKELCARELESVLNVSEVFERLRDRMLSKAVSSETVVEWRMLKSFLSAFPLCAELITAVYQSQEVVREVQAAWLKASSTTDPFAVASVEAAFIDDGTFAGLVGACQRDDGMKFNADVIALIAKERIGENLLLGKQILSTMRVELSRVFFNRVRRSFVLSRLDTSSDQLERDVPLMKRNKGVSSRERAKRLLSPFETKERVDKQIESIKQELVHGELRRVEKFIAELISFQIENSEQEQLAKSLCALSSFAITANQLDVADSLSERAIGISPLDSVVYTNRAEVLKNLGRFAASLSAYADAKSLFTTSSYAFNGYADVLKEMGEYSKSIEAYKQAQAAFPDSPVAFNGLVSTLRAQGRKQEALAQAEKLIVMFDDPVTAMTYAGALAANGRYLEAGEQYLKLMNSGHSDIRAVNGYLRSLNAAGEQEAGLLFIQQHYRQRPDNWAVELVLAGQFRINGEVIKAIEILQRLLEMYPGYTPIKLQLAIAFVEDGRFEEANNLLKTQALASEADWAGYRIYLLSIIKQGKYGKAKSLLEEAIKVCVWNPWRSHFATLLGFTLLKLNDAQSAVKVLQADLKEVDQHVKESRVAIIGAAQRVTGKLELGDATLRSIEQVREVSVVAFRDAARTIGKKAWLVSSKEEFSLLLNAA